MASFSSHEWNTAAAAVAVFFFDSSLVVVVVAVAVPSMVFITSFLPLDVMKCPVFASRMIKEGMTYKQMITYDERDETAKGFILLLHNHHWKIETKKH